MHLPLHRRESKRLSTPPPTNASASAPSTPEASGTPATTPNGQASDFLSSPPPPHAHGHGLKGLGRRMTASKPARLIKNIASRTSLRGAHARQTSAGSVRSVASLREAEGEHEEGVKKEVRRDSGETDYGKEVTKSGIISSTPEEKEAEDVQEAAVPSEGEHAAEVRQEQAREEQVKTEEPETRVEQPVVAVSDSAQQAAPAVEAVIETVDEYAKEDVKGVAIDAEEIARDPKKEGADDNTRNAESISLSSSSTTVDHLANNDNTGGDSDNVKQVKMEQEQEQEPVKVVPLPEEPPAVADINPFIVDDPEDPLSEPETEKDGKSSPAAASSGAETPVVQSVVLSTQVEGVADKLALPPAPVVVEDRSPPPAPEKTLPVSSKTALSSESSSEEEAPELHTPALTVTSLFLPVPQTDPLSALLTKHVPEPHLRPPRDTSGEWQHTDFHTLVMTNNWRALARMARDRIVTASPGDVELILNLWYIRLSSLARLRLFNQASAECENLFGALATIEPPTARAYILRNVLPFELEVLRARCAYWAGDQIGYLDDVAALLQRCRVRARQAGDEVERSMWKERGARMALIVASQLVEMKDYTAATSLLSPLLLTSDSGSTTPIPSPALRSAIARIHLQAGHLSAASRQFDLVDQDPSAEPGLRAMNAVVRAAAEGDWEGAKSAAKSVLEGVGDVDVVAANNYAVALLGQGRIKEGIQVLETNLQASPSLTTTTEPYLFNLSTMYELRASLTAHKKRALLVEVAKWSGDGLRTACLKMNA